MGELVEVLEYALVVLVSLVLTVFSIGVYTGLASFIGPARDQAEFDSVVALANSAIEHGSSSSEVVFDNATIGCSPGVITFQSAGFRQNSAISADCSFPPEQISGPRQLVFDYSGGLLTLQVR
jgi:NDP-sugar pyrophosphorylase family protein